MKLFEKKLANNIIKQINMERKNFVCTNFIFFSIIISTNNKIIINISIFPKLNRPNGIDKKLKLRMFLII